jgi:Tol biopolymer transport system component
VPAGEIARFAAGRQNARDLAWKADGSEVYFVSEGEGIRSLLVDTGSIRAVTGNKEDSSPAAGPATKADVVAYLRGGQLAIMTADGTKTLSAGLGWQFSGCVWSPDGDSIVYTSTSLLSNRLGIYSVSSGSSRLLEWEKGSKASHLVWPSESSCFFVVAGLKVSGRTFSSIMRGSATENPSEVMTVPGSVEALAASPDGRIVYFISNKIIYSFDSKTGAQAIVADKAGDALALSPDGKWLLTNPAGIAVCPADGGKLKQIVSAPGIREMSWSVRDQIAAVTTFGGRAEVWTFRVDDSILK